MAGVGPVRRSQDDVIGSLAKHVGSVPLGVTGQQLTADAGCRRVPTRDVGVVQTEHVDVAELRRMVRSGSGSVERDERCWVVVPFRAADQPKAVQAVLEKAEKIVELNLPKSKTAYIMRNKFMVDRSEIVVGFWSGSKGGTISTLRYALKVGREVHAFPIDEMSE